MPKTKTAILLILAMLAGQTPGYCPGKIEDASQRTYVQKVYLEGNQKRYEIHTQQIHYKDGSEFKPIDTTIRGKLFGGWQQDKASYKSDFPKHADGTFEFHNVYEGADYVMKAKPEAAHVEGQVFNGTDEGNYVLYPDAFGKGKDLKVYAYAHGLKKVIVIKEKPVPNDQDLTFDFELILDSKIKIKRTDGAEWDKQNDIDFKDKTIMVGPAGKESYFRNAIMWDSGGATEPVPIELMQKGGKLYIRKTVPKEFLEKATFPVYTDHPTAYYAGSGDGWARESHDGLVTFAASYATAHAAAGDAGFAAGSTGETTQTNVNGSGGTEARIYRGFFAIDTSGIDDGATISAATLNLYITAIDNDDNDGNDFNVVVEGLQASTTTVAAGDFDACGDAVTNPTEGSDRIDLGSNSTSTYNTWTLDADGIGWISKTGTTKLGIREGHDVLNDTPNLSEGGRSQLVWSTSEATGTSQDPYLNVTVAAGGPKKGSAIVIT